jgi:hypothetical protein
LHKHAVRKITTRRVTKEYKDKIVNIMWQRWIAQVNEIGKLYQKIRTKCAKVVYYISHGAAVGCFANWKVEILSWQFAVLVKFDLEADLKGNYAGSHAKAA